MPGQDAIAPASKAALARLARQRFDRELQNQTLRNPAICRASAASSTRRISVGLARLVAPETERRMVTPAVKLGVPQQRTLHLQTDL
jgi:hypothetical protein